MNTRNFNLLGCDVHANYLRKHEGNPDIYGSYTVQKHWETWQASRAVALTTEAQAVLNAAKVWRKEFDSRVSWSDSEKPLMVAVNALTALEGGSE